MKIYIFLKIAVLLFCTFSSTLLNGGIIINGNAKDEKSTNTKPSQNNEEITITAISEIGTYPEFKGLTILLDQLKENVVYALTGKTPYRIKSNIDDGTVKASKKGNKLMLEVTLIPCEESERHYFFDGAAGIYSYINTTSFSSVEGKVRKAVMEKANVSFSGTQPQEAYPNHIKLKDFTNLNTVEPNKEYKLILKFLVGKRPGGYFIVRDEKEEEIDRKIFNENQLLYSNQSKVYLPNIQSPKLSDEVNNKLVQNNSSSKSASKNTNQETLTDQSGNTYKTVRIGNMIWMAENLRTTHFSNGENINFVTKPGRYISRNFPEDNGYTKLTNGQYLYTWATVQDVRGIAPPGWHVATENDWSNLIAYCGSTKNLRSVTGWQSIKSGGYYQTVSCPNCINWNAEYRRKIACHTCQDNRLVKGKYIPVTYTSMNGNDRFQFNAKQLGNMVQGQYSNSYELFWTSTLDTRPKSCGSSCGQAYIVNLIFFGVISEPHSNYMLPIRLVKDNNVF